MRRPQKRAVSKVKKDPLVKCIKEKERQVLRRENIKRRNILIKIKKT